MQAVILAGGLGTRLWPITNTISKPMVPVAGKPYLYYQITVLRQQGISNIVLLTGYLGDQIEQYFGDGSAFGVSIRYSREDHPLGTGGALREAHHLLAAEFLLIYGDSYLPIRYPKVLADLTEHQSAAVIVIYDNALADTTVQNNIAIDEHCLVTSYEKLSSRTDLAYVDAGVLAMQKSVLDYIPPSSPVSLEQQIFPKLISERQLTAHVTSNRFYDIGTPDRLRAFEAFITDDHHAHAF